MCSNHTGVDFFFCSTLNFQSSRLIIFGFFNLSNAFFISGISIFIVIVSCRWSVQCTVHVGKQSSAPLSPYFGVLGFLFFLFFLLFFGSTRAKPKPAASGSRLSSGRRAYCQKSSLSAPPNYGRNRYGVRRRKYYRAYIRNL